MPEASEQQAKHSIEAKKHIVQMPDGSQRRVWTDETSKQDVWEVYPRSLEEVRQMHTDISVWLRVCKDRRMHPKMATTSTGVKVMVTSLYPQEMLNRVKEFPEITSASEHNQTISKLIAINSVLGYSFGWPVADFDKPIMDA